MNVYVVDDLSGPPKHFGTRTEAHAHAKKLSYFNVSIELRDVPLDKENVLRLLDHAKDSEVSGFEFKVLRRWVLTPRGGLRDAPAEENVNG